jgi:molybdopterin synthase catalytic subunit
VGDFRFVIQARALSLEAAYRFVQHPLYGGVILFLGTVRSPNRGKVVRRIEYTAFREMAQTELARIGREAAKKWEIGRVYLAHRVGILKPAEASVAVAVSAPHRGTAFSAARYCIDQLKARVPIWKKEIYTRGSAWVENRP